MATTFDPNHYKTTTRAQWEEAAEAWHQWGPTIEQWLGNIYNPCRLKIAETHCYKLSGEHVVTVIPALADIAAAAQVCQQPVRGAAGNV